MPPPCPGTPPLCGQVWPWTPLGSHSAELPVPLKAATNRGFFQGAPVPLPKPQCSPAILCRDPSTPQVTGASLAGAAAAEGPGNEGQTGEAGTGTVSPLVNSAGPCSLFKALNRGWYLSCAELEAGRCWSWFNTLRQGWKDGEGGTRYPRWGHVEGVSCRHMPFLSLPPTIYMVMRTN